MTGTLYALGRLCARHRWVVMLVWLVIVVAVVVAAKGIGQQTSDNLVLPGTDSDQANQTLTKRFPSQANGTNPLTFRAPAGKKLTDSSYKSAIDTVQKAYENDHRIEKAVSPFSSDGSGQITKDAQIAYISLTPKDSPSKLNVDEAHGIIDVSNSAKTAGLRVAAGGYLGQKVSKPSTHASEVVGIVAAVVILLLTFGTFVAMGLPILTAILGLATGLSIITLIGPLVDVPTTAPALATMIGLGVGIDYGLFVVTRHRDQLRDGMQADESIARSIATSGGAVLFAGSTVIIALLALAVAGIPLVTTLGYTAAIVVLIAVVAALTLMPALLGALGTKVNALPLPGMRIHHDTRPHGWRRWAMLVADHPWPALVVGVLFLVVLAVPVRHLHLGQTDVGALPTDTQARQAYDAMSECFGPGSNGPMLVAVDLSKPAKNDQSKLDQQKQQQTDQQNNEVKQQTQKLEAQGVPQQQAQQQAQQQVKAQSKPSAQQQQQQQFLESTASDPRLQTLKPDMAKASGVKSVSEPLVNSSGSAAVYTLISDNAPSSRKTEDTVNDLRDSVIPKATKGQSMKANVGGTTAGYIDLAKQITSKLPLVIAVVLALSFLLLMCAFRSVLVPLKAVVMNLLSIGA